MSDQNNVAETKVEPKNIEEKAIALADFVRGECLTDITKAMNGNKQAGIRTRKNMKKVIAFAKDIANGSKESK